MEISIIQVFFISLFITLGIVRILTHRLDGPNEPRARTPTKKLRHKTGYDIHHLHIGLVILVVVCVGLLFESMSKIDAMFLGIGLSLVLDQVVHLKKKEMNYFSKKSIMYAFLLHMLTLITYFIVKILM